QKRAVVGQATKGRGKAQVAEGTQSEQVAQQAFNMPADETSSTLIVRDQGYAAAIAEARAMLDWVGIANLADRVAGALPYTDERRVAIGRALMCKPAFLLLDEPAAGMSAVEAQDLSALIRRIADEMGCGVLLIEHNVGLVLDLCHHVIVLDSGVVIETGDPTAIRASDTVRHAYMGTAVDTHLPVLEVME
ncbi:MAG: ATP-binding cassette domain-containing protein, partial [Paracoccaceae bacterium]